MSDLHRAASEGFSKEASTYASARPDYPEACRAWLEKSLGLRAGKRALEVGAGTGKFTTLLVESGATVVAVEPVAEMRALLNSKLPEVETVGATAAHLPFDFDSFDAVVCAQSFHWFATPETVREFARVLKPSGYVGLIWNVRDRRVPWVDELWRLLDRGQHGVPQYDPGLLQSLLPLNGFGPVEHQTSAYSHVGPAEQVIVERSLSTSFIAAMPPEEKAKVLDDIRALVARHPELSESSQIAFPYVTNMHWTVLPFDYLTKSDKGDEHSRDLSSGKDLARDTEVRPK